MTNLIFLIAPIFLIILLGKVLHIILIKDNIVWDYVNKLAYWVLFPCLLFNKTSVIDLGDFAVGSLSFAVLLGFSFTILFAYALGKIYKITPASLTSVLQGAGRHNAFIALAIVTQLFGEQGAMIGAIIIAILVTFTNIVINTMLASMLSPKGAGNARIISELKRNPIIIAILIGLIFNLFGWGNLPILHEFTATIGQTTLTVALLCVGAGLRINGVGNKISPLIISCIGKFIIFPGSVYLLGIYVDLPHAVIVSAIIFAVSPAGASSYPLAKLMGGDAPLMATIISVQTLLSVLIIPVVIILLN
ncbi:MAG: AEC family transporter [Proteobacteria bacterium]|jgi:malonate transporter and related proteins|nr:AEC family transporter [Pseudomonadota bacterium]